MVSSSSSMVSKSRKHSETSILPRVVGVGKKHIPTARRRRLNWKSNWQRSNLTMSESASASTSYLFGIGDAPLLVGCDRKTKEAEHRPASLNRMGTPLKGELQGGVRVLLGLIAGRWQETVCELLQLRHVQPGGPAGHLL